MHRLMDREFVTALVLLGIGAIFVSGSGDDVKDWGFPLLSAYTLLGIGAVILIRFVVATVQKRAPEIIEGFGDNRVVVIDLLVFCAIVLAYILVMKGIGFWLDSFLLLLLASSYLTKEKTRRNMIVAVVMSLSVCVLAYVIFLHVFYVPLPEASWWPDGS